MGPFPYHRLPKIDRAEVALRQRFARRALPGDPAAALATFEALAGTDVLAVGSALHVCDAGTLRTALLEPLVGVVLAPPGARPGRVAILELDPLLAAWLADRMLGGDGATVDGTVPLADVHRGAIAFGAARVANAAGAAWRVGGVVTTEDAFAAALGDEGSAVWSVELLAADAPTLGAAARSARLWLPTAILDALAPRRGTVGRLDVTFCADAGEATFESSVVRTLRPGDVVVPDVSWWSEGRVRLGAMGARRTVWWCSHADDGLTIERSEAGLEAAPAEGRRMTETEDPTRTDEQTSRAALEAVGDAPVSLAIELARFELALDEIAALEPGEVVASGVPIGREVRLRAGTKVIATGELVEVEGEVGVRLIALGG